MPRDTQPQEVDELYARVIFTAAEYAALTVDEQVFFQGSLLAALEQRRQEGWNFNVEDVKDGVQHLTGSIFDNPDHVIVSKTVRAYRDHLHFDGGH